MNTKLEDLSMYPRLSILSLLSKHGPMFGLDLVEKSGGDLKRGTVYVHLAGLQDEGRVTTVECKTNVRNKYKITEKGRRHFRRERAKTFPRNPNIAPA